MKVFQINITREMVKAINAGESVPAYKAHLDAMFGEYNPDHREFYTHVADFPTDDLDRAFEIGNIGPEAGIVHHHRWHSVSVGDVLVKDDGRAFIVQSFGFGEIKF